MNSNSGGNAASGPETQDQQLLVFLQDVNLKVSQMSACGNSNQISSILDEANLNVETLL